MRGKGVSKAITEIQLGFMAAAFAIGAVSLARDNRMLRRDRDDFQIRPRDYPVKSQAEFRNSHSVGNNGSFKPVGSGYSECLIGILHYLFECWCLRLIFDNRDNNR